MTQQYTISEEKLDACIGKTFDVLVEGYDPYTDSYYGRTYMDAPDIDNNVILTSGYRIDDADIVESPEGTRYKLEIEKGGLEKTVFVSPVGEMLP